MAKATDTSGGIVFERKGLGAVISSNYLAVPINQRSYMWKEEHVGDLLADFQTAIREGEADYFLGTIVFTRGEDGKCEVADGQQRLATATIVLAAIRDYLHAKGDTRHTKIEHAFLVDTHWITQELTPRLRLNVDDDEFFASRILSPPGSSARETPATKESHRRIAKAADAATRYIKNLEALNGADTAQRLMEWVVFIENSARVIVVTVPDHADAFVIFETLNDRGLELSKSDLLKNYLFGRAGKDKLREIQAHWTAMIAALETVSDDEDITVTFIRHLWISLYGYTRDKDLYKRIKERIRTRQQALELAAQLSTGAMAYSALLNPSHESWKGTSVKRAVAQIRMLGWKQVRPLMLAIVRNFAPREVERAYRTIVGWTVRYLIGGGLGSASVEEPFADCAKEVSEKKITTTKGLLERLAGSVPTDAEFRDKFLTARVNKPALARYYLRAMESHKAGEDEPELVPNDNEDEITLEHVLPQNPDRKDWSHIKEEDIPALTKRIGNLALFKASSNHGAGKNDYPSKAPVYKKSSYVLTQWAGTYKQWDADAIADRQSKLAEIAVKTWPLMAKQ